LAKLCQIANITKLGKKTVFRNYLFEMSKFKRFIMEGKTKKIGGNLGASCFRPGHL
jgi:hypothetical protein